MSNKSDLAQLYIAFFDRAPDATGLSYWMADFEAGNISLEQIVSNWVNEQPEGQAKYPAGLSSSDFINAIYSNVLSRVADSEGLQYWQNQLDSGAITRDTFIAAVINGAHANTTAQGLLDAKLLSNKAEVGIAFADKGLNDTSLAAKVLTTVNSSVDSLNVTLSLIKLVPGTGAGQTSGVLSSLTDALAKVAALISSAPNELQDLATYLQTVSAAAGSTTDVEKLLTKVAAVSTAALSDPHALDNPVSLGNSDVADSTPSTGGGVPPTSGGGTTPTPPALTATVTDHVLKLVGAGTSDVIVDLTAQTVTIGGKTVSITSTDTGAQATKFFDVDATGSASGFISVQGTVKEIAFKAVDSALGVDFKPVFSGVDSHYVVDDAWTILTTAQYYLQNVQGITVKGGDAGALSIGDFGLLKTLTGIQEWTYEIRDSASQINAASGTVLANATKVVVADTLSNLESVSGSTAIGKADSYIVRDTWDHISNAQGPDQSIIDGAEKVVLHDTVQGVQDAVAADYLNVATDEYQVEDTALNLLAADASFLKKSASVVVTGDDAGELTLQQRSDLGKLTDDDFWHYTIKDSFENVLSAAQGDSLDFIQRAGDISFTESLSVAQIDTLKSTAGVNANALHYSVTDKVSNISGHASFGDADVHATASGVGEVINGSVTDGTLSLAFDAAHIGTLFTFNADGYNATGSLYTFNNFNASTDRIDLSAFGLDGKDTLSLVSGETNNLTDGHYAVLNNVVFHDNVISAAADGETAGTLILWDADTAAGSIQQVGVWLAGQTVDNVVSGIVIPA